MNILPQVSKAINLKELFVKRSTLDAAGAKKIIAAIRQKDM